MSEAALHEISCEVADEMEQAADPSRLWHGLHAKLIDGFTFRSIKGSLNLDHVRCKSPEMVHRELWTTLLAYNLIRTTAAAAALHEKQPRQISFTGTCQQVLAGWMTLPPRNHDSLCL